MNMRKGVGAPASRLVSAAYFAALDKVSTCLALLIDMGISSDAVKSAEVALDELHALEAEQDLFRTVEERAGRS